ncbi:hypothetical protein IT400_03590 [Candidatus Nomurabacteria bacterium]|nr:hypothetical protein [Candidatus Nomurabacteria bacterium]
MVFVVCRLASIYEKLFGLIIHKFVLVTSKPRGAWKILAGIGFGGNSAQSSALRADAFFGEKPDFVLLRSLLDKVRMFFEENPEELNY